MEKKVFKSGDIVTPEVINELMNLSFDKKEDEVGYLPLPGDYSQRVETFETSDGSVDLSKAKSSVVIIVHYSKSSLAPETINVDNVSAVNVIFFVPRGMIGGHVTLSLPFKDGLRQEISIGGGNSAIISNFNYSGGLAWKICEIRRGNVYIPSVHDIFGNAPIIVDYGKTTEITSRDFIKVSKGCVDLTIQLGIRAYNVDGVLDAGSLVLYVVDDSNNNVIASKSLSIEGGKHEIANLAARIVFYSNVNGNYGIRALSSSMTKIVVGSNDLMEGINITGVWADQNPS